MHEYDEYNEEEDEVFSREGGIFQIDTPDLKEVRRFKEDVRKSNKFNIIKLKERSDNTMFDNYELEELVKEFNDEDIDEELEKALKIIPEKLKEALGECYKILNEFKEEIKDLSPDLFSAIGLLARLATTGKPGLPSKYPYPKKVEKSMNWSQVQDMLFGGHLPPADNEEIEKSSKSNPFPSISRALEAKQEAIEELEDEMEQDSFNPYDRMA